jgi:putative PIN family toxin of toxin-antitoxin system
MRIVMDTNVLVSALVSHSNAPARILDLWRNGALDLLASPETLAELRRVLYYPRIRRRLRITDEQVDAFHSLVVQEAIVVEPSTVIGAFPDDPDDDKFAALAVGGEAQSIVTGDRHMLRIVSYEGIPILTPAAFLHRQNPRGTTE